jgi:threonine dehydrogenase-like Zn-dependent dehydrogenase
VPQDVIDAVEFEAPRLEVGQALVEVVAAPINPSDVLTLTGEYGQLPPLPAVGGREGVGRVAELGADTQGPAVGQLVLLPVGCGSWSTHVGEKQPVPKPNEAVHGSWHDDDQSADCRHDELRRLGRTSGKTRTGQLGSLVGNWPGTAAMTANVVRGRRGRGRARRLRHGPSTPTPGGTGYRGDWRWKIRLGIDAVATRRPPGDRQATRSTTAA